LYAMKKMGTRRLAKKFEVACSTIHKIIHRRNWKHVN
jgi:uncharacterized protein YjcR